MTGYADYVNRILERRARLAPDFDIDSMLIVMGSVRLGHLLSTSSDGAVHRPVGGTFAGFRILFALWMLGPQSTTALARMFDLAQPTVTGLVDGLEADGLVVRVANPDDGRSRLIALTDEGVVRVRVATGAQDRHERELLSGLTPSERHQLSRLLGRALGSVAQRRDRGA